MKKQSLLFLFLAASASALNAQIQLPVLISDNMVLQQNSTVKLWGKALSPEKVKITTEWSGKAVYAQPDNEGNWQVAIQTPAAGGPYQIEFKQKNKLVVDNVMLGEVWLCSGQSNMEMPVKGFPAQPVERSQEVISSSNRNTPIRLFTVPRAYKQELTDSLRSKWCENTPSAVADFSATGYFFALQLYKALQVPVGMINASWGGSKIEAWMPMSSLRKEYSEEDIRDEIDKNKIKIVAPHHKKSLLYNAMINPLKNYYIQGVIWYQGESNSDSPEQYKLLSKMWMHDWRDLFNRPDMPFYITQIAPFRSVNSDSTNWAVFRDAQTDVAGSDSLSEIVFTMDIGNEICIHPAQKKEVGERLAYCALARNYGIDGLLYKGPVYKSYEKKGDSYIINMDGIGFGLNSAYKPLKGFEFLLPNGKLITAKARITGTGTQVEVFCDKEIDPTEIRYAYKNYPDGNLFNSASLPAAGFRIILQE